MDDLLATNSEISRHSQVLEHEQLKLKACVYVPKNMKLDFVLGKCDCSEG